MEQNLTQFPQELLNLLKQDYSQQQIDNIIKAFNDIRFTTFRVNLIKSNCKEIESALINANINFEKNMLIENAYKINSEDYSKLTSLDCYKNGDIYIQSFSSMLPPLLVDYKSNMDILDMCSAPGGKTTMIASLSKNSCYIMACEKDKVRTEKLKFNVLKQGANKINVVNIDALKLDDFYKFDIVFLDAPCSGSGTLNKYSNNRKHFSKKLVDNSSQLQKKLLNKAINITKTGGIIVYSTCSILKQENEDVIQSVLNTNKIQLCEIDSKYQQLPLLSSKLKQCLTVLPTQDYEGFFVVKLKKIK